MNKKNTEDTIFVIDSRAEPFYTTSIRGTITGKDAAEPPIHTPDRT